jgi:hypothetical protein
MSAEPRQNTTEIERQPPQVVRRHSGRRKPTRLDHRTRVGRRARELREYYVAALVMVGREMTVELTAAVSRASELCALVEDMRAKALRGTEINADDLVRMQRLADTSVRRLNLPSAASKPVPTLQEYLADNYGQEREALK